MDLRSDSGGGAGEGGVSNRTDLRLVSGALVDGTLVPPAELTGMAAFVFVADSGADHLQLRLTSYSLVGTYEPDFRYYQPEPPCPCLVSALPSSLEPLVRWSRTSLPDP